MANLGKPHTGDKGTDFQLEVFNTDLDDQNTLVDLILVQTMEIVFTDPDGLEITKTAVIANPPGEDGVISFINPDVGFLVLDGFWFHRAKLTFNNGNIFQSNDASFEVLGKQE